MPSGGGTSGLPASAGVECVRGAQCTCFQRETPRKPGLERQANPRRRRAAQSGWQINGGLILRILHVQETLSPTTGGPANVLPHLVRAQSDAGHEVVVATTNVDHPRGVYHRPGWDTLADGAVPVFYAPVQFVPLRMSWQLTTYLRRSLTQFDVIHVHGLYRFPATSAAFLCRRYGIPYIIRPHGSLDPFLFERSTSGRIRLKRLYERLFDFPNLNAASAVHFTAQGERERASFLDLRSPAFIIPNGLDWDMYSNLPERGEMRARWGLGNAPVVLFLGRLHPQKGLDVLIPAFDKLRRRNGDAHLVIAGPDSDGYGAEVQRWVSERKLDSVVHFVGPLIGADLRKAYVDADVFVLSSHTENFGMTVIEAMACGLPVVVSDQVGIHKEVSRGGAGVVTRCESDEVAGALGGLLSDADARRAMGYAGRKLVKGSFSWPAIVNSLTKEYEAIVERKDCVKSPRVNSRARRWRSS